MFKGKMPLIIALLLGLAAMGLAYQQIKAREKAVSAGWELQKVVVASTDLQPGVSLTDDVVTFADMPRRFVYDSVLVPADMEVAFNREVVVPIKRNEPIHWYQLQGVRSLERLSKAVRKRGRAISMEVTERSSVGQMVRPNDHVDVLGTFRDPRNNAMVAVTLLQNVIVLATGQNTTAARALTKTQYGSVTLLVLPEEAEIMVLAQDLGSLYLSLRNREDISIFEERARTTMDTLLTGERVNKLQQRRYRTIQIIRGIKSKRKQ